MAKFCSACGSPAEPGMQFCVKCGRQFPSMQAALLPGSAAAAQPRVGGEGGTRLSAAELALIQHPHGTSQVRIHLQGQYGSADDVPIRRCVSDLAVVCGCLRKSWRGLRERVAYDVADGKKRLPNNPVMDGTAKQPRSSTLLNWHSFACIVFALTLTLTRKMESS